MNFRCAHRDRVSFHRAARRLRGAGAALAVLFIAFPCLAACGRPAGRVEAVGVDERLDIELSDGRIVRLGGLDAPNAERGAPDVAMGAREFLSERLLGRDADLIELAGGTDRWGGQSQTSSWRIRGMGCPLDSRRAVDGGLRARPA